MTVNALTAAAGRVQSAIQRAAAKTGIDFDYLMGQAKVESGFNASAKAAMPIAVEPWLTRELNHSELGSGRKPRRGAAGRMGPAS